jgi:hypothetical protein
MSLASRQINVMIAGLAGGIGRGTHVGRDPVEEHASMQEPRGMQQPSLSSSSSSPSCLSTDARVGGG